jgi:hypothetical protein
LDRSVRGSGRRSDDGSSADSVEDLADQHRRSSADEEMSKADEAVEKASQGLRDLSEKAAARGGVAAKLAQPLADDAAFVRKLKPSLIKARAKGELPTDQKPEESAPPVPAAPRARDGRTDRNPIPLLGAAFGAGVALAKLVDWRGHAHPRD